jgi:hypothetical protein
MKVVMSLAAGCAMSVVVTSRVLSQASSPNDDPGFQAFLRQFEQAFVSSSTVMHGCGNSMRPTVRT